MKFIFLSFSVFINLTLFCQQTGKIDVPNGVVYKYSDSSINAKAERLVRRELSDSVKYSLNGGIMFIGPVLWNRYKNVSALNAIKEGNITILGYKKEVSQGKLSQSEADFKLVWDHLRGEIAGNAYKLRKATAAELKYYWSVISFDIVEPLIIIETDQHNYILNIAPEKFNLVWLDEAPKS